MKPLLDAVMDDVNETTVKDNTSETTATGDKAGRQKCHDDRKGGRRGSDEPACWASMGWSCGPTMQQPFGPPCGSPMRHLFGPRGGHPFGPRGGHPLGPSTGHPFGPSGGHPFGPWGGHSFGPSGGHQFGPSGGHQFGPSEGNPFGPPGGHSFGPRGGHPFGPRGGHPFGPSGGHPFGPSGGYPFGPSAGHPFGPSGGQNECMWGMGPPFMNGPAEYSCPWERGMPQMNDFSHWGNIAGPSSMHGPPTFGPMTCPWDTNLSCDDDETVDDESDEWDAGKESAGAAGDAGKDSAVDGGKENADNTGKDGPNPPKEKDGALAEKSERSRWMCPWSDGMRRRRMRCSSRHANTSCRRHNPFSMYRRCRCGPWAQSRYAPWAAFSGDCCQQTAPTGWGECPYPSPFFAPFACNWSGESYTYSDTDNQKQEGDQPTPEECCRFFKGAPAWFRQHGGCCSERRWQGGPSRNKIYKMLTRRRNMVKEKLQRIESMLANIQPSEEEAKETSPQSAAAQMEADSGKTLPSPQQAASQVEADPGKTMLRKTHTDREWEMIADSE